MLGKTEGRRRKGHQRMRWLDGITNEIKVNLDKLREMVRNREAFRAAVQGVTKSRTRLGERIATTSIPSFVLFCFVFTYLETKVL